MARKPIFAGIPNFAAITEFVECAGASEASGFEASKLQDPRPSEAWRSTSVAPHKTIVHAFVQSSMTAFFRPESDIFGVLPTNLGRESGLMRVLGFSSASLRTPEEVLPNGNGSLHNATSGGFAQVDEGWAGAADGSVIVLESGQNLHLQFATPAGAVTRASGSNKQQFVVEFEPTSTGSSAVLAECWLYESDVLKTFLGYKFMPSGIVGEVVTLVWTWDASVLGFSTGASAEIRFRYGADCEVHRVGWISESEDTYATDLVFDTGWTTVAADLGSGAVSIVRPEEEVFPPYALHVAASGTTYDTVLDVHVLLIDDQVPTVQAGGGGFITAAHPPRLPAGYVEAGVFMWALGTELTRGARYGRAGRIIDPSPAARTIGGQLVASGRRKRRAVYVEPTAMTEAENYGLFDRLDLLKGTTRPFLVIPEYDNAKSFQALTVYGTLQEASEFSRQPTQTTTYTRAFVIEEFV